jgi:hypothetical protein
MSRAQNSYNSFSNKYKRNNGFFQRLREFEKDKKQGIVPIILPKTKIETKPCPNCKKTIKYFELCCDECQAKINELKYLHNLSK